MCDYLGKNCNSGKFVCHRDIKFKLGGGNAVVCNNGKTERMTVPEGYTGRADFNKCDFQVSKVSLNHF